MLCLGYCWGWELAGGFFATGMACAAEMLCASESLTWGVLAVASEIDVRGVGNENLVKNGLFEKRRVVF